MSDGTEQEEFVRTMVHVMHVLQSMDHGLM